MSDGPLLILLLLLSAALLDCFVADPRFLPHPVLALGWLATRLENMLRKAAATSLCPESLALRRYGLLGLVLLTLFSVLCMLACIKLALILGGNALGFAISLYLAWSGLALGSLLREGRACLRLLKCLESQEHSFDSYLNSTAKQTALEQARYAVSLLVSRDTLNMIPSELRRSLAESLSENFCDAFVAPLFWLTVGCMLGGLYGPALLWGYKSVSTLDSMWGYKNEHWRDFGRAAAKADDILAYLPARLSVLILWLAAPSALRANWPEPKLWLGLRQIAREAASMESPNSGWPMSAAAWLIHARMGGPTPYHGEVKLKPLLGPEHNSDWDCQKLEDLLGLLQRGGLAACTIMLPLIGVFFLLV